MRIPFHVIPASVRSPFARIEVETGIDPRQPEVQVDPYIGQVVLLMRAAQGQLVDASNAHRALTLIGSASVLGSGGPFGGGCLSLSGGYVSVAVGADLEIGTGAYTIEFWLYETTLSAGKYLIGATQLVGGNAAYPGFPQVYTDTSGRISLYEYNRTGGLNSFTTQSGVPRIAGRWNHIAIVRTDKGGGIGRNVVYINGAEAYAAAGDSASYDLQAPNLLRVGADQSGSSPITALLADLRLTAGVARTITVPTAPFPTI